MASPSLRRIQAALSCATETFAAELAAPGSCAPHWSEFEWTMAQAAAVLHGVTPLLANRLHWSGPVAWQRFAASQFQHVRARHHRIGALLDLLHHASAAKQIGFIALKGAALHDLKIYLPGQRPMADIDLLVSPEDAGTMAGVLQSLGYAQTCLTWKHAVFAPAAPRLKPATAPFGEHQDAAIKIELHTAIVERLPLRSYDISHCIMPAPLPPGRNAYPSNLALLTHLLLHAAPSMMARNLRLIQLHDIASLGRRMTAPEWTQLTQRSQPAFWALPPLQLAQRYFPGCVPAQVLSALAGTCPRALRRLSQKRSLTAVSYAQLSAQMLPGLAWSASMPEKALYVWRRIRPSAEQRAVLAATRAEAWAEGSSLQHSYAQRIIRQLLLRPPRPSTMHVVRAALADSLEVSQ